MKYFVVSDVHGYYNELRKALLNAGFDESNSNHMLISCGDIFDRGSEPFEIYSYLSKLKEKNRVILVKGNHEDLMLELLARNCIWYRDILNGTVQTVFDLASKLDEINTHTSFEEAKEIVMKSVIPSFLEDMLDYYETKHYYFTHGYLPYDEKTLQCDLNSNHFKEARWYHGYELARNGIVFSKTVCCGHVGSNRYRKQYGIEDSDIYGIIEANGVISIDAQTDISHQINVLVIED